MGRGPAGGRRRPALPGGPGRRGGGRADDRGGRPGGRRPGARRSARAAGPGAGRARHPDRRGGAARTAAGPAGRGAPRRAPAGRAGDGGAQRARRGARGRSARGRDDRVDGRRRGPRRRCPPGAGAPRRGSRRCVRCSRRSSAPRSWPSSPASSTAWSPGSPNGATPRRGPPRSGRPGSRSTRRWSPGRNSPTVRLPGLRAQHDAARAALDAGRAAERPLPDGQTQESATTHAEQIASDHQLEFSSGLQVAEALPERVCATCLGVPKWPGRPAGRSCWRRRAGPA